MLDPFRLSATRERAGRATRCDRSDGIGGIDVVLLVDQPPAESAEAGDHGDVDWLARPTSPEQFRRFVERALLRRQLGQQNRRLDDRLRTIE